MNFELAHADNSQAIANLINKAYRGNIGWTREENLVSGNRISSKQVGDIILNENSYLFMIKDMNSIIACICIEKNDNIAQLGLFAVNPSIQNKGLGNKIINLAEEFIKKKLNISTIEIIVLSERKELISYYERRGYKKTNIIKEYPKNLNVGTPKRDDLKIEYLEKNI